MKNIIFAVIFGVIAIACITVAILQFKEKGFLLNNVYIYASKQERERMNKKPYYKQTGIVFVLIGIIFLINTINLLLCTDWLIYLVIAICIITLIYAIVSSILIEKNKE